MKDNNRTRFWDEGVFSRHEINIPNNINNMILIYEFLKKNFGKPTHSYLSNFSRQDIENDKFYAEKTQWTYLLKSPNGYIQIYDKVREYVICYAFSRINPEEVTANDLFPDFNREKEIEIKNLNELKEYSFLGSKFSTAAKKEILAGRSAKVKLVSKSPRLVHNRKMPKPLEQDVNIFLNELKSFKLKWKPKSNTGIIILNPYYVHYLNFKYHYKLLNEKIRNSQKRKYDYYFYKYSKFELEHINTAAFILLFLSFEGLINLLYELFLRKDIREDDKIKEKIMNDRLENKMKMLSFYCTGFKKPFRRIDSKFTSKFRKLVTLRNRMIHANLFEFRFTNMQKEDDFLFYYDNVENHPFFGSSSSTISREFPIIMKESKKTVDDLINQILLLMDVKIRKKLRKHLKNYWIGYIYAKNNEIQLIKSSELY